MCENSGFLLSRSHIAILIVKLCKHIRLLEIFTACPTMVFSHCVQILLFYYSITGFTVSSTEGLQQQNITAKLWEKVISSQSWKSETVSHTGSQLMF